MPIWAATASYSASSNYGGVPYQGWSVLNYNGYYSFAQTMHQGQVGDVHPFWATTCPWTGSIYDCHTEEIPGYLPWGNSTNTTIPTIRAYGYHQIRVTGVGYSPSIESYAD